jgi:hypothetical protein
VTRDEGPARLSARLELLQEIQLITAAESTTFPDS